MTLLLLAGTTEARQIAARLAENKRPVMASLAGAVRDLPDYPVPLRVGGFGGDAGFAQVVQDRGIRAVLDATHPFAARITERTARLCLARGLPYARLSRPEWTPRHGDDWRTVASPEEAARTVPRGARVFLATGAQELERYRDLEGRAEVFCRRAEDTATPFPFAQGRWIIGRGPFHLDDELALFRLLCIDWVVTKNAGGTGAQAKLEAARHLQIPVVMIRRPPDPKGVPILTTVDQAVSWATSQCA